MVDRHHSRSHTTLTNLGNTCIAFQFFFVCTPISFSPVYRSGAFGWIDATQASKKSISHTYPASSQTVSSCAVDFVTVILVFCRFSLLRIALYSYIYCLFRRLSIELYPRYMINRYTPCWPVEISVLTQTQTHISCLARELHPRLRLQGTERMRFLPT